MGYQLFDANGNEINLKDTEEKSPWCVHGATKEGIFLNKFGGMLGLIQNPEKTDDKFAPDLLNTRTGKVGDLKTQNTPFFTAERYGKNPQYTVTFNVKDAQRYSENYPEIEIYFWVDWIVVRYVKGSTDIRVEPMSGVWFTGFKDLIGILERAPVHEYIRRVGDKRGNAKSSYVLELNDECFKQIV